MVDPKLLKSVTNKDGSAVRVVFDMSGGLFAVVKLFTSGPKAKLSTVKLWDLSDSSLEKTMSYWTTNVDYQLSTGEERKARTILSTLIKRAANLV